MPGSAPVTGELVLGFHYGTNGSTSGCDTKLFVYPDDRIVWEREDGSTGVPEGASERSTGYLEHALTPEGTCPAVDRIGSPGHAARGVRA